MKNELVGLTRKQIEDRTQANQVKSWLHSTVWGLAFAGGVALLMIGFTEWGNVGGRGFWDMAVTGLIAVVLGIVYFFPTILAGKRDHRNLVGIGILNLFLGWTLLGWVVALVWAVYEEKRD